MGPGPSAVAGGDDGASRPLGVYVHVPFCVKRCSFCHFYTLPRGARSPERYLAAVGSDLGRAGEALGRASGGEEAPRPRADTVFFGGGTPSLLVPGDIGRLLGACGRAFRLEADAEITLEANPESCDPARVEGWLHAGINRVSLGVQSFQDPILRGVGRLHDGRQAELAARALRRGGLGNLNLDLIAGLPGMTRAAWRSDLERALALEPDHLSLYMLEPHTSGHDAPPGLRPPSDDETAEFFLEAMDLLKREGFGHYEISNFARPGRRSRHNLKYWTDEPFLGVGPSAWSYLGGRRWRRVPSLRRYVEAMASGASPVDREATLDRDGAAGEALYLGLRLLEGVDLRALSRRYGLDLAARYASRIHRLSDAGLLQGRPEGGRVRLTRKGVLLANEVFVEFVG